MALYTYYRFSPQRLPSAIDIFDIGHRWALFASKTSPWPTHSQQSNSSTIPFPSGRGTSSGTRKPSGSMRLIRHSCWKSSPRPLSRSRPKTGRSLTTRYNFQLRLCSCVCIERFSSIAALREMLLFRAVAEWPEARSGQAVLP